MPPSDHEMHMLRALSLARRGRGAVEPNPMVGAVLVRDGKALAEGFHPRFGGPHAEIVALQTCRDAGLDPRGADLYVTLEPCCHQGKTPPCTDALIQAGIAHVLIATTDPNPLVAGKGTSKLRKAGIAVELGLCRRQAQQLIEPFAKFITRGLPYVTLKWAQTVDGLIATRENDSRWISNPLSRRWVHQQRALADAILIGIGTALADDPLLTARGVRARRQARRVVVDPSLRLPTSSRLIHSLEKSKAPPLLIAVRQRLLDKPPTRLRDMAKAGVGFIGLPPLSAKGDPSVLALEPLLRHLAAQFGATHVLAEGGSTLNGHLLRQGLGDELAVFIAPKLLGDAGAVPAVSGLRPARIDQATSLELRDTQRLGDDMLLTYRLPPPPASRKRKTSTRQVKHST
ncbi:MAG: bifunctional diaminohydroxyphosphoribosylaminopyrimidine deaminase/5-amino-6-(5-phosphoribosylamino)uracil reductase RibD [Phycisphaeraceae bacterium]|nr:bifunctional diaminohydroxyphosphoribosylaminopyrimidine deaminase/5-amino-6-(5-phosphoribosylamino)uracil reductase RibD [Phycisphaeraceae bacterium]